MMKLEINDEVENIKKLTPKNYKAIQFSTFRKLKTYPSMWEACKIKSLGMDKKGHETITFDIPSDYETVMPFTDSLSSEQLMSIQAIYQSNIIRGEGAVQPCELCGHGIKHAYPIKCDSKKLLMWVGNVCVGSFLGAEYMIKMVTEFKETLLRKIVNSWKGLAIKEIHTNPRFKEYNKFNEDWIKYDHYKFADKLAFKTNTKTMTSRKLINLLRTAKYLQIQIPKEVEMFILTKKELSQLQKGITEYSGGNAE